MRKINQLKAGSLLTYVSLVISTVIPLLYTPIMLNKLGQAEYGLYSLSNSIISYLSLLTLGLGTSIMRYMMKYRVNNDKIMFERVTGLFVIIYGIISIVVCFVGLFLSIGSDVFFSKGLEDWEIEKLKVLIIIMSISTAVSFVSSVYSNIIVCNERYIFRKLVDMILTIFSPLTNLIVLFLGYASIGMAIMGLIAQIITLFINIWYCRFVLGVHTRFKNPPIELLRNIFSFTAFVFVGMIADLLYWATDKVLIGAMIGSAYVAVYNIGSTFNTMLQNFAAAISGVFAPRVNTFVLEKKPISDLSELMIRVGRLQYLLVSLILSGFILFGNNFLLYWAGAGYSQAYTVALMTMIPLSIPLIQNIAFTAICAMKKHKFRSILYVILAIINVISTYLLLPYLGIIGAALCTCVVFVCGHGLIMNWYYYKKVGLDIPKFWLNICRMTIVPAVLCIVYKVFEYLFLPKTVSLLYLLVEIIVFTLIYCIFTWLFTMNKYEKNLFLNLIKKPFVIFSKNKIK